MKRRDFIVKTTGAAAVTASYSQLFAQVQELTAATTAQANYDVIVLGVGSMGASACYNLAKRGIKVLGLEQFDIPHELGSHAGQSRIIRKAYGEGSSYVPLLERAYKNWQALEEETGSQVYFKTGLAYFGTADDPFINTVIGSSEAYKIPLANSPRQGATKDFLSLNYPRITRDYLSPMPGF